MKIKAQQHEPNQKPGVITGASDDYVDYASEYTLVVLLVCSINALLYSSINDQNISMYICFRLCGKL